MNDLIVKSNNLIEGFMSMTANEYKLTLLLISRIKKDDVNFRKQSVKISEIADLLGQDISKGNVYRIAEKLSSSLLNRKIVVVNDLGDNMEINWFSYCKRLKTKGLLEIAFNSDLESFLLQIKTSYTKYYLKNIKNMKHMCSLRLYEILKQYEKISTRIINYNELSSMLGVSYKLYGDFKRNVLIKAKKDLNTFSDLSFEFEEIKEGRRVSEIKFMIKSNNKNIENNNKLKVNDIEDEQLNVEDSKEPNLNNTLVTKFNTKYNANIGYKWIDRLVDDKGFECVYECIDKFKNYVSSANEVEKIFFDFTMRYGTDKAYTKTSSYNNYKPVQATNYEQRKYDDDFFNSVYDNVTLVKKD